MHLQYARAKNKIKPSQSTDDEIIRHQPTTNHNTIFTSKLKLSHTLSTITKTTATKRNKIIPTETFSLPLAVCKCTPNYGTALHK